MKGWLYVLFYAVIFFILFFGLVSFFPKTTHDQHCTYTLRPFIQTRYVSLYYPVWSSRHCK